MKKFLLLSIRWYQKYLSPETGAATWFVPTCRFFPTCSEYTYQAISKYGILHGSLLSFKRLSKCHPWHSGGFDPVK